MRDGDTSGAGPSSLLSLTYQGNASEAAAAGGMDEESGLLTRRTGSSTRHRPQVNRESASTDNDGYSGDRYSGNDGYSGLNPPDDAILFTVSGITAIADKKLEILIKNRDFDTIFYYGD